MSATPEKCLTCGGDGLDPETTCGESVNDLDDAAITCSDCGGTGLARVAQSPLAARDDAEFYAETLAFLARLDAHRAEQIRALHAFGDAIATVARSRWCPECRGTRLVVVAGVEEDCDRCDALGVLTGEACER